jgi:hypothetical protein
MPFRFNRTARDLPQAEGVFENGNQAEPVRDPVVSTLCRGGGSSTEPSITLLILSLADETIPSPGVPPVYATTSLRPGGGISDFLGALRNGRHGDRTIALALLATRSIVHLVLRSTNSARTSPIFSKGTGYCVIRWAFGRVGAFFAINVSLAFFLPTS